MPGRQAPVGAADSSSGDPLAGGEVGPDSSIGGQLSGSFSGDPLASEAPGGDGCGDPPAPGQTGVPLALMEGDRRMGLSWSPTCFFPLHDCSSLMSTTSSGFTGGPT